MDDIRIYVPFQKVNDEERTVFGQVTAEEWDEQDDIVEFGATKMAMDEFRKWRNVREMHSNSAVGIMPVIEVDETTKAVRGGSKIVDDQAWRKCKEGVYKGYSIGGKVADFKLEMNPKTGKVGRRILGYRINEISLVDRPALSSATFSLVKNIEGEQETKAYENVNDMVKRYDEWAGDFQKCVKALEGREGIESANALGLWIHKQAKGVYPQEANGAEVRGDKLEQWLGALNSLTVEDLKKQVTVVAGAPVEGAPVSREDLEMTDAEKVEFEKERKEHPELDDKTVLQIVRDHAKEKANEMTEENMTKVTFSSVVQAFDVLVKVAANPEEYHIVSDTDAPEEIGIAEIRKGDVEGHPFHGNQFSDGSGGGGDSGKDKDIEPQKYVRDIANKTAERLKAGKQMIVSRREIDSVSRRYNLSPREANQVVDQLKRKHGMEIEAEKKDNEN